MRQIDAIAYPNPTDPVIFSYITNFEFWLIPYLKGHNPNFLNFRHVEQCKLTMIIQKPFGIIDYHWHNDIQLMFHLDMVVTRSQILFLNPSTLFGSCWKEKKRGSRSMKECLLWVWLKIALAFDSQDIPFELQRKSGLVLINFRDPKAQKISKNKSL